MKVVKREAPKKFQPVEVVITIETENEYNTLETLFRNSSASSLNRQVRENNATHPYLDLDVVMRFLTEFCKVFKKETSK